MSEPSASGVDRLSLVVFSEDFDRVHYALAMAAAARAIDRPATLFFTQGACRALVREGGWRALPGAQDDQAMAARGLPGFETLLESCVALGAAFMVCEMGLRAVNLTLADLRDDVPYRPGGIVTWLYDTSPRGGMLFI